MTVDLDGPDPLYEQIARILEERITAGTYQPRRRIPSEAQLVDEFGVSRPTARAAVQLLVDRGLVHSVPGKGPVVADCPQARRSGRALPKGAGPRSSGEQRDSASGAACHPGQDPEGGQRPPGAFECADPELVVRDVGPDVLGLVEYAVDLGLDAADRLSQVPHLLIHLGAADVHARVGRGH